MYIKRLTIRSFRCFEAQSLELHSGFNVIVGQNNSGKTALARACSLNFSNEPHRSLKHRRDAALPESKIEVVLAGTGQELREELASFGEFFIAVPSNHRLNPHSTMDHLFTREEVEIRGEFGQSTGFHALRPSHNLKLDGGYGEPIAFRYRVISVDGEIQPEVSPHRTHSDIGHVLLPWFANHTFAFNAERLNIAASRVAPVTELKPDASNLAQVLHHLQSNEVRYKRFLDHVRAVFPTIQQVKLPPSGDGSVEIRVWNVPPETERDDLAVSLVQCGTGIYRRLSSGPGLIPPIVSIALDREAKSEKQISDLERALKGVIHFLPRRMYENYLLNPDAIAAVLNSLPTFKESKLDRSKVADWIAQHYGDFVSRAHSEQWEIKCDAASLLSRLFSDLTQDKEKFEKVAHSLALTEWFLENRPQAMDDLGVFVERLAVGAGHRN